MATAVFSGAGALSALSSANSQRLVRDDSAVFGRHSGLKKVTSHRVKRSERQIELCRAGVAHATSVQPRRRMKDEAELIPVSPDDGGYYSSENQVLNIWSVQVRVGNKAASQLLSPRMQTF